MLLNSHSRKFVRRARRSALLLSSAGSVVAAVPAAAAMQQQVQEVLRYEIVIALFFVSMLTVNSMLKVVRRLAKLKVAEEGVQDRNLTRERLQDIRRTHL